MIKFNRLQINGAFSYGKCDVSFEPGLVLLDGVNKDDGERISNMAGKTSLFNSLTTVLFEQNSKSQIKDDIINVFGNGTATIHVEVEANGRNIELEYTRGGKTDWSVKVNGESATKSIREMKGCISDLIGMDYAVFLVSAYMEQGLVGRLVSMKDDERKSLVTKYFGLDVCDVFRNKVKVPKQQVYEELLSVGAQINQLNSVEVVENIESQIQELELTAKTVSDTFCSKEQYEELQSRFNKLEQMSQEYKNLPERIAILQEQLANTSVTLGWCNEVLTKVSEDKCYVCGSVVDGKVLKVQAENQRIISTDLKTRITQELAGLEKIWSNLRFWDREKELAKLNDMKNKIVDVFAYRQSVELLGSLKRQKKVQDMRIEQLDGLKAKKTELDTMVDVLDFWYEGFSPKGIQAMVLDRLLVGLNSCIQVYANRFGWSISCIIENDRLVFSVKDKWKKLKINYFSGSESMLIGLLVALGVWRWLNLRGKGTNILFLDEVFAPFDAEMRLRIAEILKEIAKDRCVVVTTHHDDMKNIIPWDKIWMVEKKDGISNLRVY